ncbi:MAG: serine protease [Chthoniobacterales bacterium]
MRRNFCLLLAAAAVLCPSGPAAGEPVIDDEKMEEQFVQGIIPHRKVARALTGRQAAAALVRAAGKKAPHDGSAPGRPAAGRYVRAREAVVVIGTVEKCRDCREWHMGGVSSGWLAGPDGLVATSYHVLEEDSDEPLGVMFADGAVHPITEVVASDRDGDAVFVRLGAEAAAGRPWLSMAEGVATGAPVHVVSHPDGRFYSLTEGIVSRVFDGRQEEGGGRRRWVTVTADYGAGSSGAPVLDEDGRVIGMVSSTAAVLADPEEGREAGAEDVQMVFKDCVSWETLRGLLP